MRAKPYVPAVLSVFFAACGVAALSGCASQPATTGGESVTQNEPGTQPEIRVDPAELIGRYNERALRVRSLWANLSAVIEGKDAEGRNLRERAEGHLQIVPPDRVAITLGKVGINHLYFGSDDLYYWWFDMIDDDEKVAIVGRHALVTPDKIDLLGLPINPLDLVVTLGIIPLPGDADEIYARPGTTEDEVIFSVPTPRGGIRIALDEQTAEPSRIAILSPDGRPAVDVKLSRYTMLKRLEPGAEPLRVPARIVVRMEGFDGEIRLSLSGPELKDVRPIAFQVDELIEVYSIDNVIDLDETGPAGAGTLP